MALKITNLDALKTYEAKIKSAKAEYDQALKKLKSAVMSTEDSWDDRDGYDFRDKLIKLINTDLKIVSDEMNFEVQYLKKSSAVLENTQQEVKNRLNG